MARNNLTLPTGLSFERWSAQMVNDLSPYTVPVNFPANKWWDWANQLITLNNLGNVPNASRQVFKNESDWSKWAAFFCSAIVAIESG